MIRWEIKMCCCWFLIGSLAHLKELSDLSSGPLGKIDADVQLYWLISSVKAELFSGGFQTVLLPFSPIKSLEIYFTNKTTTACIPLCLSSRVEDHHATLLIWAILSPLRFLGCQKGSGIPTLLKNLLPPIAFQGSEFAFFWCVFFCFDDTIETFPVHCFGLNQKREASCFS